MGQLREKEKIKNDSQFLNWMTQCITKLSAVLGMYEEEEDHESNFGHFVFLCEITRKIYTGLCPRCLRESSENPGKFLSLKSTGSISCSNEEALCGLVTGRQAVAGSLEFSAPQALHFPGRD